MAREAPQRNGRCSHSSMPLPCESSHRDTGTQSKSASCNEKKYNTTGSENEARMAGCEQSSKAAKRRMHRSPKRQRCPKACGLRARSTSARMSF